MKYLLLLLAFPILSASECGSKKDKTATTEDTTGIKPEDAIISDSIPVCVRKIIEENKTKPGGPVKVDEYRYKNQKVYLLTAPCCDQYNMLYDDNCKSMCAPTGGFTGKGDKKCPDFSDSATFIKQIWKMGDN